MTDKWIKCSEHQSAKRSVYYEPTHWKFIDLG